MKSYRIPNGGYYFGENPESGAIECALWPSPNHVFSDNWSSNPMNPDVCWRMKTALELDAEKLEKAKNLIDYKIAIKALAQVTWNALPDLKTAFPTYQDYQTAIINQYKALI